MKWTKKKIIFVISILLVAIVAIPIIIHVLFKQSPNQSFWIAEWSAGEFLSYYGAILSFIGTVALGALALYQNALFKKQNDKVMQLQNVPYFSYVNLEPTGQTIKKTKENLPVGIYLKSKESNEIILTEFDAENLSNYPIYSISAKTQAYDPYQGRWVGINMGGGSNLRKKIVILPGKIEKLHIGFEPFWRDLRVMGFGGEFCGIMLTFENTNGLSTYGRVIFYKDDSRTCKYNLIPLSLDTLVENPDE